MLEWTFRSDVRTMTPRDIWEAPYFGSAGPLCGDMPYRKGLKAPIQVTPFVKETRIQSSFPLLLSMKDPTAVTAFLYEPWVTG